MIKTPLDQGFMPISAAMKAYAEKAKDGATLHIALQRDQGLISTYSMKVLDDAEGLLLSERVVKSLLWMRGGFKITLAGPSKICEHIKEQYKVGGAREFDRKFMSGIYEREFEVVIADSIPDSREASNAIGRHLDGCRIGFDAGGSDRKVSAVIDGEAVYSEEVIWHPKEQTDPQYHFDGIKSAFETAASHMPRVDAIGVSSAGVYINNRIMAASLFIKVASDDFNAHVKDMYLDVARAVAPDAPIEVANDGDVTALAGAMDLEDVNVIGVAMGTSEAGGYVDAGGNITGWLNEFAFVPVDVNPDAMVDEWSGDYGCGVKYFSQDAVVKLAPEAGIEFETGLTLAEKLKVVQKLMAQNDPRARKIYETIGVYFGYEIAYYAMFYDIKHVLIMGRVTSGEGGQIILLEAKRVLDAEFPEVKAKLHIPDESSRRVGQSIAAASLPEIK